MDKPRKVRTVSNKDLRPNEVYQVRGKIGYSHITRPTTDEERIEANKRRYHPIDKNYTTITIHSAYIIPASGDPNNLTLEEKYGSECFYASSSPNYPGNNYNAINKSPRLPRVGVLQNQPGMYQEIIPEGELAAGLDVTLVMRVFKGQGNNGVTLDMVLVNEPIRYYGGTDATAKLAQGGVTFKELPPDQRYRTAETEYANAPVEENTVVPSVPEYESFEVTPQVPVQTMQPVAQPIQQAPVMTPPPAVVQPQPQMIQQAPPVAQPAPVSAAPVLQPIQNQPQVAQPAVQPAQNVGNPFSTAAINAGATGAVPPNFGPGAGRMY